MFNHPTKQYVLPPNHLIQRCRRSGLSACIQRTTSACETIHGRKTRSGRPSTSSKDELLQVINALLACCRWRQSNKTLAHECHVPTRSLPQLAIDSAVSVIAGSTDPVSGPLITLCSLMFELYAMQVDPRYTTVLNGLLFTLPKAKSCANEGESCFEARALRRWDHDRLLLG